MFTFDAILVSSILPKLGRVHYGMDPIGLRRSGRARTQDPGGNRRLWVYNTFHRCLLVKYRYVLCRWIQSSTYRDRTTSWHYWSKKSVLKCWRTWNRNFCHGRVTLTETKTKTPVCDTHWSICRQYVQCESKNPPPPDFFLTFFPKQLGIFSRNFTRVFNRLMVTPRIC